MEASYWSILKHRFINFCMETTVHGVPRAARPKLHFLERFFWTIILILCLVAAVLLSRENVNRFYDNPTVVSIQKDYRNWFNYFPSATGCFVNKGDEDLIDEYLVEKFGLDYSSPNYEYYRDFAFAVANISYDSLGEFEKYANDTMLNKIDLFDLAVKVHPELTGTLITFDTNKQSQWTLVMTEMGVCFSMNTKVAKHFSISDVVEDDGITLKCHYLNGLCYARYDSDPLAPMKMYIHSFVDIGHATATPPFHVKESQELEINFQMQETSASDELRYLSPKQRQCRYIDEPIDKVLPAYSPSVCYVICRYRLVMKLCGCRPFFYHRFPGKLCDLEGLVCVAKHAHQITQPPLKLGCKCPQPCDFITYTPLIPKITVWEYGYFDQRITFRWGLMPPTTKYRRDIIFGFEDLVVSIGGTVALFLGVSFISVIEIVYFLFDLFTLFFQMKIAPVVRKRYGIQQIKKNVM